jgi:hypothetical protein
MGGDRGACNSACVEGFSRCASIDLRELRACAATRFACAGIGLHFVDTAVLTFVIADASNRSVINPLGYCLAVGRRLQEESIDEKENRRRKFEAQIENTCPHGSSVEHCGQCERDIERALDLFPSLGRHLPASLISASPEKRWK